MSYTPIELDKTRNLRYGMKALSLIEKKFKKPLGKVDFNNLTIEEMAVMILAGLYHEDNKLTIDKVMELVDEYSNIPKITEAMTEAMGDAMGTDKSSEDGGTEKND